MTRFYVGIVMLAAAAGLVAAGCAPARTGKAANVQPVDDGPYKFESEGKVPPLADSEVRRDVDKVDTFEELPVENNDVSVENVKIQHEDISEVTDAKKDGSPTSPGYRIQVFASGSAEKAEEVRHAVEARLGTPAYVEVEAGVFKVRVGNCVSREQAQALLDKVRSAGYQDAWIANTTVVLPKRGQG